jgi:hypothetical protein
MKFIIKTKEGLPFETESAAIARQTSLKKEGVETVVAEDEGGWVLKRKRPQREQLGTKNVLRYPERPGYHRHVINDVDDNILNKQREGYEIVQKKDLPSGDARAGDASQMGMPVTKHVGNGTNGVLMEMPQEWYDEYQAIKQNKIKSDESAMSDKGSVEGGYGEVTMDAA